MEEALGVGVREGVLAGVLLAVLVLVADAVLVVDGVGVFDGVMEGVLEVLEDAVIEGVLVSEGVGVPVPVCELEGVCVFEGVCVAVIDGVPLGDRVEVGVFEADAPGEREAVLELMKYLSGTVC